MDSLWFILIITLHNIIGLVSCGDPSGLSNGDFIFNDVSAGSYAKLKCPRPFVETGDSLFRCDDSGSWIGSSYCRKLTTK